MLKDGTREVRFYFFGWAHTRGDGFVYLPKEQVLCTGDAVVNGPYNFTGDATSATGPRYPAAQTLTVGTCSPATALPAAPNSWKAR